MGQIRKSQISFSFKKKRNKKTRSKIEVVARAFVAFEMKLPIIASSEKTQKKLKLDYENRLQKFKICDQLSIEPSKRIDDTLQWPHVDKGVIFVYILKVKGCDLSTFVDTKIKKSTHILIVCWLKPFLLTILLVVEIQSFYILKLSLLLKFEINKCCGNW